MKHPTLYYDESCPMCRLYSSAFERTGILKKGCRLPLERKMTASATSLDKKKARHEIPLYLPEEERYVYGLQALLHLLQQKGSIFRQLARMSWLMYSLNILYKFISYNRRVIAASSRKSPLAEPDFHLGYRLAYSLFALTLGGFFTFKLLHFGTVGFNFNLFLHLMCAGIVTLAAQFLLVRSQESLELSITYLGHLSTLFLLASGMLLLAKSLLWVFPFTLTPVAFLLMVTVMGLFISRWHAKRVALIELPRVIHCGGVVQALVYLSGSIVLYMAFN